MKRTALIVSILTMLAPCLSGCADKVSDADDRFFENCAKYADFGAVGDGKTDDFAAIKAAHEYANEHGVPVKAESGAEYYIGAVEDTVPVETSVDWSGAKFIIDDKSADTDSRVWWYPVFTVRSKTAPKDVETPDGFSISAGQKNIGLTFDTDVMLAVYNDNKKDFIRLNSSDYAGHSRHEIALVDKNGNVDGSTPFQWDFTEVTDLKAYSVTDAPLLIRGGEFTTIANDDPHYMNYFERNIRVERSNTTVKGVKHYVTGEGATGSPYNGFFRTKFAHNVTFQNCVMTGHKLYKNQSGGDQGTYDTRLASSNRVAYIDCTQSNSHTDPTYWGIMCSDYCKNVSMTGCTLSRFDAHMGVYNATVKDCDIGQNISVTGGGLLTVENVIRRCEPATSYSNRFVTLREDYGSFFYGDIVIKNSTLITSRGINYAICGAWYDHDFGYVCRYPTTVTLDNIRVEYKDIIDTYIHPHLFIFSHYAKNDGETPAYAAASINPPVFPEKVIVKNNKADTKFKISANTTGWFDDTAIEYI